MTKDLATRYAMRQLRLAPTYLAKGLPPVEPRHLGWALMLQKEIAAPSIPTYTRASAKSAKRPKSKNV